MGVSCNMVTAYHPKLAVCLARTLGESIARVWLLLLGCSGVSALDAGMGSWLEAGLQTCKRNQLEHTWFCVRIRVQGKVDAKHHGAH